MAKIQKDNESTNGFVIIPDEILFNPHLSVYTKLVYFALKKYCFTKNTCWPSLNTLKDKLRISRHSIDGALKELVREELIIIKSGKIKGCNNHYTLTCTPEVHPPEPDRSTPSTLEIYPPVPDTGSNNNKANKKNKKEEFNNDAEASSAHSQCRKMFEDLYFNKAGSEFYWTVKDGSNLKQLLAKLKKTAGPAADLVANFEALLKMALTDRWLSVNFNIPNINSQFSSMVLKAKAKNNEYSDLINEYGLKWDQ